MTATELRIGNYVTVDNPEGWPSLKDKPIVIVGLGWAEDKDFPKSSHSIEMHNPKSYRLYSQFNKFVKPISLTEKWLNDFGFEKNTNWSKENENYYEAVNCPDKLGLFYILQHKNALSEVVYSLVIPMIDKGCYSPCLGKIKHVHQLQNLYRALTGSELEIK